jgi:beta-aspartyl-peptidase (threonine type)
MMLQRRAVRLQHRRNSGGGGVADRVFASRDPPLGSREGCQPEPSSNKLTARGLWMCKLYSWFLVLFLVAVGCRVRHEPKTDAGSTAAAAASTAAGVSSRMALGSATAATGAATQHVAPPTAAGVSPTAAQAPPAETVEAAKQSPQAMPESGDATAVSDAGEADDAALDAAGLARLALGSGVVAHAGVGSDPAASATVLSAVQRVLGRLARGTTPLEAAAAGVVALEDAPAFNAGTGSSLRLDGSIQMDAALMDSSGRTAAVLAIERVRNPVLVALALVDSMNPVLAAGGAMAFARAAGYLEHDPTTQAAADRQRSALGLVTGTAQAAPPDWAQLQRWRQAAVERVAADVAADADTTPAQAPALATEVQAVETGSVAVLVRGGVNEFAAAVSDGGPLFALGGEVSALAVSGAALYVGPHGAVAVSGAAQPLVREFLARAVYERMRQVMSAKAAARWGLTRAKASERVGISAINQISFHSVANAPMAWAAWSAGEERTGAEKPQ